jgi:peptidyl-prolyl cis-trans isomerase A (cyclophilin A)
MGTESMQLLIKTRLGSIVIELYAKQAPLTVANLLRYVDENRFAGACFYRVVHMDNQPNNEIKIEVIQGGLKDDEHPHSLAAIPHETTEQTGILHKDGVISMARNEPGTASSEFFICINDQPDLDFGGRRNPDGQGFAAFGRVIEGMDVVKNIQAQPADGQFLLQDIAISGIKRI